jgi:zinc protease
MGYVRDTTPATQSRPTQRSIAVEIPGKTSTVLTIGQATGLRDKDPDSLALDVGTVVLGSGFTGRLMHSVRDQEGLTYGIRAGLANNVFSDGSWQVTGTFAPQLLSRGTTSTQREVQQWWKDGVTDQKLAARKTFLVGTYQVGLSTTSAMAETLLNVVLEGREVSWLDEYPQAIQALTVRQVNTAIKQYLDPDSMVVVKTGTLPTS